jgi:hypothetical protein
LKIKKNLAAQTVCPYYGPGASKDYRAEA